MVKSLEFFLFFFQSYSKCLSDFILRLGQAICLHRTTKKALFLRFLHVRCLLITYFITVSLEKNYCLEKVLNFGSKDLYEPCGF